MRQAIKRINEDAVRTEKLLKEIERHRAFQKSMNFKDDTHDDAQMLTAAMNYANLAKQQIKARDPNWTEAYNRTRKVWVAPGGTDAGYKVPKHMEAAPADWPWAEGMWAPQSPRYNLIRAATLILAELERLERMDRKALGLDKPVPAPKAGDVSEETFLTVNAAYSAVPTTPTFTVSNTAWPTGTLINATAPSPLVLRTGTI